MKKTTLSKKGFTLTEIVIVVAIIVIISAAAFVGVAVTLKRANDSRKLLNDNKGDNFELAARESVRDLTRNAADYVEAEYYEPDDDEPVSGGEGEGEGGGGSGGGGGSPVTNTPTSTPTPTPTKAPSPTPTTAPSGGRVGNPTGTTAVPGSSCGGSWGNAWNAPFTIGADAKEFTFYVPFDNITKLNCNTGNCTVTGSGHYYTVTMTYGSANSSSFGLEGSGVNGDLDMTQVKIVSYVPAD